MEKISASKFLASPRPTDQGLVVMSLLPKEFRKSSKLNMQKLILTCILKDL